LKRGTVTVNYTPYIDTVLRLSGATVLLRERVFPDLSEEREA